MRRHFLAGVLSGVCGLAATTSAYGDAPPMPPCPAGWEQVDKFTCREPFPCPPGWKLDTGPVCVPWECQKATDCSWKGIIPCREAEVCAPPSGGRALRVCDSTGGSPSCPSGLTCQKRKLCANFPGAAGRGSETFGNWTPGAGSSKAAGKVATTAPSAATEPNAKTAPATTPAPAAPATTPTPAAPESPRRGGCQYAGALSPSPLGPGLGLGLLSLLWTARRRRGARLSSPRR